jgi:2-hydroxycyclohexanecarboxyl-CoA dehydrogenase
MRFTNRVAIVTGAGSGMGKATALSFAREGAHVFLSDMAETSLNDTAEEIRSTGGAATTVVGDITQTKNIYAVVEKAMEQCGRIDILFNHVGGFPGLVPHKGFMQETEAFWDGIIELNLKTTIVFSRAVLDSMTKQRYGKIINMASTAGKVGTESSVVYGAVKGGIIAFTKSLAKAVAPYNVNVNCVCPGPISTPGFAEMEKNNPGWRDKSVALVPLGRMGRPEEIAGFVLYLTSDEAAYITGQDLSMDGGETMV